MRAIAGVFHSRENADRGYSELRRAGYDPDDINYLAPGASEEQIHSTPVSLTEQPGMGKAIGGVVGGALGAAGGFPLGVGLTALVPGVGPVLVAGLAGMALLGAGGALAGAKAGAAAEDESTVGLPADEVFFYEDALRQGKTVIVVMANGATEAFRAKEILSEAGAESIDAAREAWWIGLRDADAERYQDLDDDQETAYRLGFEAALRRQARGKSHADAADYLKLEFPDYWDSEAFRSGYARGREYHEHRFLAKQ